MKLIAACLYFMLLISFPALSQEHSIARKWNEVLLQAIKNDFARPTIHARNLFHISAAMYDAWAVFEPHASPYFLGRTVGNIPIPFSGFPYKQDDKQKLREEAISYAVYHLMSYRFFASPGYDNTKNLMDNLFAELGYDTHYYSTDYESGSAAALGIYIAEHIRIYGLYDGANEEGDYRNLYYSPLNSPLDLSVKGDNFLQDPNCWQPLLFRESFVDQSGNVVQGGVINFLSPEWGNVVPFSLEDSDKTVFHRDNNDYVVYHNPGAPAYIDTLKGSSIEDPYKWGFALTAVWSGHLDNSDGVTLDISPASIGNIDYQKLPEKFSEYSKFYNLIEGGDLVTGYSLNPKTNQPYTPQVVPRGDYVRVIAEYWADGPNSGTPPGHWFEILNYVSDHPEFVRKFEGKGNIVDPLEWDVKSYFTLGGAMHDVAISVWSIKGFYDYIRPISAIRYMATKGQSTDPNLPNYHRAGLPLIDGYIELIKEDDPLAGESGENINEIKIYGWNGHDLIKDAQTDVAGAGWILAKDWWPYQRPSFVTPPFAGFISGHSTFSRAAAQILTLITGDEYFPGGMGEFIAHKDDFLVFEKGPGIDIKLQWAKYFDAADQCSLSRIWGGIHSPIDDIPGRKMGSAIANKAHETAKTYFSAGVNSGPEKNLSAYPNPSTGIINVVGISSDSIDRIRLVDQLGRSTMAKDYIRFFSEDRIILDLSEFKKGIYHLLGVSDESFKVVIQ